MSERTITTFTKDNQVIFEDNKNLGLDELDTLKKQMAFEFECNEDDIDVRHETIHSNTEFSDEIDSSHIGLVFWKSTYFEPIKGIKMDLVLGSDEHLDAIIDGTLDKYIEFFV